eukprot:5998493-Amphidinium_carterae.1
MATDEDAGVKKPHTQDAHTAMLIDQGYNSRDLRDDIGGGLVTKLGVWGVPGKLCEAALLVAMSAMYMDTTPGVPPGRPLRIVFYIEAMDVSASLLSQMAVLKERTMLDISLSEELHSSGTLTSGQSMTSWQCAAGETMFQADGAVRPPSVDVSSQATLSSGQTIAFICATFGGSLSMIRSRAVLAHADQDGGF